MRAHFQVKPITIRVPRRGQTRALLSMLFRIHAGIRLTKLLVSNRRFSC